MSRPTVFISFLGTNKYLPCNYFDDKGRCDNVRFIQTAVRKLHCPDAGQSLIFVTETAKAANLADLQKECRENGLPELTPVDIPDGRNEGELWEIFHKAGEAVPQESSLVFDITHSFRSLPVLMTNLLNYLRVVKEARLACCCYGAFETLGSAREVEAKIPLVKDRDAPIFDLTPFFALNDWTDAISQFRKYGRSESLLGLTKDNLSGILEKSQGRDINAATLRGVMKAVDDFSNLAHTANCGKLYKMDVRQRIVEPLEKLAASEDSGLLPQLRPVLDKVRTTFADYEDRSLENGLRAAAWCAEHNLVPQGFTMLQETIISLEVERRRERLDALKYANLERRSFISDALTAAARKEPMRKERQNTEEEIRLFGDLRAAWAGKNDFLTNYETLRMRRNQVNHGGTGDNDFRSDNMLNGLKTLIRQMSAHYGVTLRGA